MRLTLNLTLVFLLTLDYLLTNKHLWNLVGADTQTHTHDL